MLSIYIKRLVWIPVENKSCSSCIYHEITVMWSIIKLLYCNTPIDDVESHNIYLCVFLWWYWSIPKKVMNITTQPILSSLVDSEGILIGYAPKLLLVTWFHLKSSCDISQCLVSNFIFTLDWRLITICSLRYDDHVITCIHIFRRSWQCTTFVHSDECKVLILVI